MTETKQKQPSAEDLAAWHHIFEVLARETLALQAAIEEEDLAKIPVYRAEWESELTDEERRQMGLMAANIGKFVFPLVGAQIMRQQAAVARKKIASGGQYRPVHMENKADELEQAYHNLVEEAQRETDQSDGDRVE